MSSCMALLRRSAWEASAIKADELRHRERGVAEGRKLGIIKLSSEAGGNWGGLSNGRATEGRFVVGEFSDGIPSS
jgi:hypothetical protein